MSRPIEGQYRSGFSFQGLVYVVAGVRFLCDGSCQGSPVWIIAELRLHSFGQRRPSLTCISGRAFPSSRRGNSDRVRQARRDGDQVVVPRPYGEKYFAQSGLGDHIEALGQVPNGSLPAAGGLRSDDFGGGAEREDTPFDGVEVIGEDIDSVVDQRVG